VASSGTEEVVSEVKLPILTKDSTNEEVVMHLVRHASKGTYHYGLIQSLIDNNKRINPNFKLVDVFPHLIGNPHNDPRHMEGPNIFSPEEGEVGEVLEKFPLWKADLKEEDLRNDYSQVFVNYGLRPQNFLRDIDLCDRRYQDHAKLEELVEMKD
jgi:hypothetical protein